MKKNQITLGGIYLAKVTDKVVSVRLDSENAHGGWDATNLATGKRVRIKSAQRLRGPAPEQEAVADAPEFPDAKGQAKAKGKTKVAKAADPDRIPLSELDKQKKQAKAKKVSGLDAAHQVLSQAGEPMRCKEMVEKMLGTGLWSTGGKTPAATIYAAILREIQTKGTEARFKKTERGLFTVNAK